MIEPTRDRALTPARAPRARKRSPSTTSSAAPAPSSRRSRGSGATRLFGRTVTYSPKVFIPLTELCRDRCGYCTFAKAPAHLAAPYLSIDEVLDARTRGRGGGLHRGALHPGRAPRAALRRRRGLARGARARLDGRVPRGGVRGACSKTTGLLPHANAGALSRDELAALRPVAASQGMMLESLRGDLDAHRLAPDKTPERRLATLEPLASSRSPLRPGVLIGIGEDRADRLERARAIAEVHGRHGHVQEVIVQNFLPKPRTAMADWPPRPARRAPLDDRRGPARPSRRRPRAGAAEPRRRPDLDLEAGADDLGGISPVTLDHVNPERAWPQLDSLRRSSTATTTPSRPRLTVYPSRGDPGAVARPRAAPAGPPAVRRRGLRARRRLGLGRHRAASPRRGARTAPAARGAVAEVLAGVALGHELGEDELVTLFSARGATSAAVCEAADELAPRGRRRRRHLRRQPQHQLHQRLHVQVPLLRLLQGPPLAEPARRPLPARPRRGRASRRRGRGAWLHRGLPPRRHPSVLRRRLLPRRAARRARGLRVDPHPRLQRARGPRGCAPLGRSRSRYLVPEGRGAEDAAGHRRRDPRRRGPARCCAPTRSDRAVARGARDRAPRGAALERDDHVRRCRATALLGAAPVVTRELQRRTGGFTEFVPLPFVHMATPIYLRAWRARGRPSERRCSCTPSGGSATPVPSTTSRSPG